MTFVYILSFCKIVSKLLKTNRQSYCNYIFLKELTEAIKPSSDIKALTCMQWCELDLASQDQSS